MLFSPEVIVIVLPSRRTIFTSPATVRVLEEKVMSFATVYHPEASVVVVESITVQFVVSDEPSMSMNVMGTMPERFSSHFE